MSEFSWWQIPNAIKRYFTQQVNSTTTQTMFLKAQMQIVSMNIDMVKEIQKHMSTKYISCTWTQPCEKNPWIVGVKQVKILLRVCWFKHCSLFSVWPKKLLGVYAGHFEWYGWSNLKDVGCVSTWVSGQNKQLLAATCPDMHFCRTGKTVTGVQFCRLESLELTIKRFFSYHCRIGA